MSRWCGDGRKWQRDPDPSRSSYFNSLALPPADNLAHTVCSLRVLACAAWIMTLTLLRPSDEQMTAQQQVGDRSDSHQGCFPVLLGPLVAGTEKFTHIQTA